MAITCQDSPCCDLPLTDKETEAQIGEGTCPDRALGSLAPEATLVTATL